jgi:hypothetical protein
MNDKLFHERVSMRHHEVAVDNIARSLNRSKENVNTLYSMVLRHYGRRARIKNFLSALVTKRVKELLKDDTLPSDVEGRRGHAREL